MTVQERMDWADATGWVAEWPEDADERPAPTRLIPEGQRYYHFRDYAARLARAGMESEDERFACLVAESRRVAPGYSQYNLRKAASLSPNWEDRSERNLGFLEMAPAFADPNSEPPPAQPQLTGEDGSEDIAAWLGARSLATIPRDPPPPLLIDRLDPNGHTILYGEGGVGKGTTASYWITQLVAAGHHVLVLDYEDHPDEWSRRVWALAGQDAVDGVTHVSPHSTAWNGPSGAIWDHQDEIKKLAEACGAAFIVIDSIIPACAGVDVSSGATDAPSRYVAALQHIGLPVLSIAHVTKEGSLKYPFGSVFWHNLARFTWSLSKAPSGDTTVLTNRKHNNYEKQPAIDVRMTWLDGLPRDVGERPYSAALADLIDEALIEPLTLKEVVARLNEDNDTDDEAYKSNSVYRALQRGVKARPQRFTVTDKRWQRYAGGESD